MKTMLFLLVISSFSVAFSQSSFPEMSLIPAGEFVMGRYSANPSDWQPEHKVYIDEFYMDRYEITNKQYYEFCMKTKNPLPEFWGMDQFKCGPDYPDYPVVGVSYFDADKYAKWAGKRLPTEAEWEYAAKCGQSNRIYPWDGLIDTTKANYGKKFKGIIRVGSFEANEYGLFDISGNVWEWTSDNYGSEYYSISPVENPKGPESGRFKVIRGGSWHSGAMCLQTFFRNGLSPSWIDFAVGFRCVKDKGKE